MALGGFFPLTEAFFWISFYLIKNIELILFDDDFDTRENVDELFEEPMIVLLVD